MSAARIRGFLLQQPKPHSVRVTSGEGEQQTVKVIGKSYAKVADTLWAIGADVVECVDAEGNLLRAIRLSSVEAQRSQAAEVPAILAMDSNAALLTHFANLLHRAYEHSTELAFVKLVEVTERIGDRAENIEARLERQEALNRRMNQDIVDDAIARADEAEEKANAEGGNPNDLLQNLAGSFLSGMAQAKPPTPAPRPPAKTNGAHPKGHS